MKQIIIITILTFGLAATYTFAQMGHGMMRDDHMMEQGHMMDKQGMQYRQGMMEQQGRSGQQGIGSGQMMDQGMTGNMMGLIQDMAIMMRQMSVLMGNMPDMDSSKTRDRSYVMSSVMRDMAAEMTTISDMMGKGAVTEEQMRAVHNRMMELQKEMRGLRRQD